MATEEGLVLDGVALNDTTNFIMESFSAPPPAPRVEWLQAADSEGAALTRDPLHENREVTFRLRVSQLSTMDLALAKLGTLVAKLEKASQTSAGIAMTWTPAGSTKTLTFDVLEGHITGLPITWDGADQGWFSRQPVMDVTLTCKPYLRGSEVTSSSASSATPLVTLEVASVPGDVPALGRLIVTDAATQNRRHVEWGVENLYYNSGTSLIVDSDNMTVTGFIGAQNTRAGAYDPNATGNTVVSATITAQPAAICSTGNLSHVGTFRVKARIDCPDTTTAVRLGYKTGDAPLQYNPWVKPYAAPQWSELDLGVVSIPAAVSGTQRWVGQIEAVTDVPGGVVYVDYLILVPAAEGYGVARAPTVFESISSFNARDEFNQTAGALTGKVLPVGGTWAGAGDTDDFTIASIAHFAQRSINSDASVITGRYGIAGSTNYTNVLVQCDIRRETLGGAPVAGQFIWQGVLARYVDVNNWLMAVASTEYIAGPNAFTLRVVQNLAGTWSYIGGPLYVGALPSSLRLVVDTAGKFFLWAFTAGTEPGEPVLFGSNTALATGGTLATGKPGIYDVNTTAQLPNRIYDNFLVSAQSTQAALYSSRTIEFRHNETTRPDSTNTYWGRPPTYRGSRFLMPPGTSRVMAKARRNDVNQFADDAVTDNTTVQVAYTPRYLVAPR